MTTDSIAAISTPLGEGAVAMLRITGPEARSILDRVFRKKGGTRIEARRAYYGTIHEAGEVLDHVLVTCFNGPHSYTGEDLVEISCHGGVLLTRRVLELLLRSGARLAEPGEFTQRAFLNGKMDLTQAEAVMDLIRAQTDLALKAAQEQLSGTLGARIMALREELLTTLAHVEAYIDFPDEQIDPDTGALLQARMAKLIEELTRLLVTAEQGRILRNGVRTVIFGAPNVGKSSLLNLLLGYERAIVSDQPGTTRDTLEEVINVRGIPIRLIDTAGDRVAIDHVESEGIRRTRAEVRQADLVLFVVDASVPRDETVQIPEGAILIRNKMDLGIHRDWDEAGGVAMSCRERSGEEALNEAIWNRIMGGKLVNEDFRVAINARHQAGLQKAKQFLEAALQGIRGEQSPELIAVELRESLDALGAIVGRLDIEELLGRIFSEFCIGK